MARFRENNGHSLEPAERPLLTQKQTCESRPQKRFYSIRL